MNSITRFDPVSEMPRFFDPFAEDFFKSMSMWPSMLQRFEGEPHMRVDVLEDDQSYVVMAEIPGVKKEDIKVSIDGNHVLISADTTKTMEHKESQKAIRRERLQGTISRSFSLLQDVDQAAAIAKYCDGVLELTLPKKVGGMTRQLKVL